MRYSGTYVRADGKLLPRVRYWTAWNEPNLQIGLIPQWRRIGTRWVIQSAIDYARICNAIVDGVHASMLRGEKVACGVTAARGNNNPTGAKPSVSPLAFLRAMKKAGARDFDAYAHHPYYGAPSESPATASPGRGGVTLGNIDDLVRELTRLYGPKRIWLTEYGYQTNPPDRVFGVSWATQARYVRRRSQSPALSHGSTCCSGSSSRMRATRHAGSPASSQPTAGGSLRSRRSARHWPS
jgi:hypothetical protein